MTAKIIGPIRTPSRGAAGDTPALSILFRINSTTARIDTPTGLLTLII
jgi:hypothetical protein